MIRQQKGKGTNIMGMAASQARLLSITSRMADNELRAQIANNAKMRLAADSSRISADYVNALNNATMMITNYNEAGDSQFNKLTFNRLTQYSPFNTQYGLSNTYGQLLVNENEAKIFEAAGGDLTKYLKAHGLEHDTSYFDKASWADDDVISEDGKYYIEFKDEFGEDIGKFELADLKTMYFGGKTSDGLNHLGFEANEDTYQTFLNKVSNFSVVYNRCQEDPEIIKLVEGDIQTEVNNCGKIGDKNRYQFYQDIASGVDNLSEYSVGDIKIFITNLVSDIRNISIDAKTENDPYVTGATLRYYEKISKMFNTTTIDDLTALGYTKEATIGGEDYYYCGSAEESAYEKMQNYKNYANERNSNAELINKWHYDIGVGWYSLVGGHDNLISGLSEGAATLNNENTFLIKITNQDENDNRLDPVFGKINDRGHKGLPPGYVALSKNGDNIYFLYGQNNSDDVCWTYGIVTDANSQYRHFVDTYAGAHKIAQNGKDYGISEVDLMGHPNGWTVEYDDTLVYNLSNENCMDGNYLFTNMAAAAVSNPSGGAAEIEGIDLSGDPDNKVQQTLDALKTDAETAMNDAYAAWQEDSDDNDLEKAYYAAKANYEAICLLGVGDDPYKAPDCKDEDFKSNVFMFRSNNADGSQYTEYHKFAFTEGDNGQKYFIVDPQSFYRTSVGNTVTQSETRYTKMYKFNGNDLVEVQAFNTWQAYAGLLQNLCEDAFGHEEYYVSKNGDKIISKAEAENANGTVKNAYQNYEKESATTGNFHYTVNIMDYIKRAKDYNDNANQAWTLKETIKQMYGIDLKDLDTTDFNYIGGYKDQLLDDTGKTEAEKKSCHAIYDNYILNCLFDIYGEPNITWIDKENPTGDAEAKVKWYTNMFERMKKGYTVLEDGLASSNEWMEYALESGIVAIEQVDKSNHWNGTPYSNVASITEVTDDVAVARAEAEYKKAMNEVENKDKRLDIELKNIDTEHNALQTEYESVKSVISKNVERSFKMYNA